MGMYAVRQPEDGNTLWLILRAGVYGALGLSSTTMEEDDRFEERLVVDNLAEDEIAHDTQLHRGVNEQGQPALTLGLLTSAGVRFYLLNEGRSELLPFPPDHATDLEAKLEDGMVGPPSPTR